MNQRMLVRAAIAGFAVGVIGLAVVATVDNGDDAPERLPALSLGSASAEDRAAGSTLLAPSGPIDYRLKGTLPSLADRAPAFTLGLDGDVGRIEALARALGLDGPVNVADDGWTVSAGGRVLRVERQPGLPWYFSPYAGDVGCGVAGAEPGTERGAEPIAPDTPVSSDSCGTSGTVASGTVTTAVAEPCPADAQCVGPTPVPEPQRPADLPTREQAEATVRALFTKAGIDLDAARVRVDDGITQWYVEFEPQVEGLPTFGFNTGASVGPKGVVDAHGWLAQPHAADDYPLVTSAAGFERLKESPFGIGPQPLIAEDAPITCAAIGCPEPAPVVRTISGVRLGLTFAPLLDPGDEGRALLVPVFLFDVEGGGTIPVLAVTDEFLPKPVEEPRPGATEPARDAGATEPGVTGGGSTGASQ
jgi:hypothetical protein